MLERITPRNPSALRAVVFDFDGTISTLRCGWEQVMRPLMLECIAGEKEITPALEDEVDAYIDESTGIQTIYQMQWLARRVVEAGGPERDAWAYKDEYNRRLMQRMEEKKRTLESGTAKPEEYTVAGAAAFLHALRGAGLELYLASGTDDVDVKKEAALLGVADLFTEIKGAPAHMAACSKEAVLGMLFEQKGFTGGSLLVVGDGKVEIALGKQHGAWALGAATDEVHRRGVNEIKRRRLIAAGADAISGDFEEADGILEWMGMKV